MNLTPRHSGPQDNGPFMAKEHGHCREGIFCQGPGCIRRTGKTDRKRHHIRSTRTGHANSGGHEFKRDSFPRISTHK